MDQKLHKHSLELIDISKSFAATRANKNICLKVRAGEIHAILGENGAGKSTLMNIIYGVIRPDSGSILWFDREVSISSPSIARELGIAMVFQHFALLETLSVAENLSLFLPRSESKTLDAVVKRIEELNQRYAFNLDPHELVANLSVGQKQRVEIARALLEERHLLILDEPTSVLTPLEVEELHQQLKQLSAAGMSILYISHKLDEVRAICDRATIIRAGEVSSECDPRATSTDDLARLMLGDSLKLDRSIDVGTAAQELLSMQSINLAASAGRSVSIKDISISLKAGEIVGLAGVAGNGQAELLDLIGGELFADSGEILFQQKDISREDVLGRRQMGILTCPVERRERASVGSFSLAENLLLTKTAKTKSGALGLISWSGLKQEANKLIDEYEVKASGADALADELSGGNLQKFLIGREVSKNPKVLICYNPTWGVDVGAANRIHHLLAELRSQGTAILVISEDLDELFFISDRLGAICGGQISPIAAKPEVDVAQLGAWMMGSWANKDLSEQAAIEELA